MHPAVTLLFVVSLMMTPGICNGHAMGPPVEACRSMVPEHGTDVSPQTTKAPYGFNFSDSCFKPGHSLQVTLAGVNGSVFRGFFVQARKPNDDTFSYGTFSSEGDSEIATIDCFNQSASAIGHYNQTGYNFTNATFEWTAPADVSIDVIEFVATVVLEKQILWTGLRSDPMTRCSEHGNNSSFSGSNETSTETLPTTTAIGNFTPASGGTLSAITATATTFNKSDTTVAITTATMTDQTTSGGGRRRDSMLSLAFSVAFIVSFASGRPLTNQ